MSDFDEGVIVTENDQIAPAQVRRDIDGHRLAEFVYGTVTGLVAITGIGSHPTGGPLEVAGIVIAGALAIWLAHGYSILLSKRITSGHRLTGAQIRHAFGGSWPIVIAGAVLATPILLSGLGLWSLETGVGASGWVGVAVLALVGVIAGAITRETWTRRILLALSTAGIGIAVVAVEYIVHH